MTADAKATTHDWTAPGVYPVAPGVHRVPLPLPTDGLRAVNVYVVEDDGGLVLIDSGWALEQARTALTSALAALGAGLGDIRSFLVTHVHRDHYTLAVQLRREFGSAVSLGLGERQAIAALSGGMKKRAALARALALDPAILFFDEPSAGLDPITSAELDALIVQVNKSLRTTIVAVSHELPSIFAIADRCIMLDQGTKTVIAEGDPRALRDQSADPRVHAFFNRQPAEHAEHRSA